MKPATLLAEALAEAGNENSGGFSVELADLMAAVVPLRLREIRRALLRLAANSAAGNPPPATTQPLLLLLFSVYGFLLCHRVVVRPFFLIRAFLGWFLSHRHHPPGGVFCFLEVHGSEKRQGRERGLEEEEARV